MLELMLSGSKCMNLKGQVRPPQMRYIPAVDDAVILQFVPGDRLVPVPVAHFIAKEKNEMYRISPYSVQINL
jgi:hypothetical protein